MTFAGRSTGTLLEIKLYPEVKRHASTIRLALSQGNTIPLFSQQPGILNRYLSAFFPLDREPFTIRANTGYIDAATGAGL